MRVHARISFLTLLACVLVASAAPAAAQAAFGLESHGFFAANCKAAFETCGSEQVKNNEPVTEAEAKEQGFTQAAGHPNWGVTDFKVTPESAADPIVHIRTDVAPGLSTAPAAVGECSAAEFEGTKLAEGVYSPPTCNESGEESTVIGKNEATVNAGPFGIKTLTGKVYNLVASNGHSSTFGVALVLPEEITGAPGLVAHTFIEGNVEWGQEAKGTGVGDYHDYFEINVSPTLPLLRSRLVFKGNIGKNGFITNGSNCEGPGRTTATRIRLESLSGAKSEATYTDPIGLSGCNSVPFEPGFLVAPETTQSDANDGVGATVSIPHPASHEVPDNAALKTATVKLPEGMTVNPSAAAGLQACTPAQAHIHSSTPGTACPAASKLGTVTLVVPQLKETLAGNIYLGGPESGPITGPPYTMYLDAESARYGLSIRIRGEVFTNEVTGQVTTVFPENPEQPFSEAILHFNGGALAPIANPLICGSASAEGSFAPYTGTPTQTLNSPFTVDSNGKGGACSSPLPFSPSQSTSNQTAAAGAKTSFNFTLERPEGNQYLKGISTTLPEGLVGLIPTAEQCAEAQANAGTCPAGSAIGSVTAYAGSGPTPYAFPGTVYLTGPYKGAPFGMSVVVPEVAGPFNLGLSVTRATININQETTRVTVASEPPLVVKGGIEVRLRKLDVHINRQGFLVNPTNCSAMKTESTLTGVQGSTATLPSAFQVEKCNSLAFKPSFKAASSAKASKANGASLETTINLASGSANIQSVLVTLPAQLPSRGTTLKKACLAATFNANPYACPSGSFVGGARANSPTLKDKLKGPAILVSHANAAFPDLDLLFEADGVKVIVKGTTDIKKGITTTNFEKTPDTPVSSVTVNLPIGPHSALAAFGDLCAKPLYMPTVITGQNGVQFKQKTKINVNECGVKILKRRVIGNAAFITVKTFAPGRLSGTGGSLASVYRHLRSATTTTIKVPLSGRGRSRGRPFKVRVRIGFLPKNRKQRPSATFATLTFG